MTLQGTAIVNLIIEIIGIMICFFALITIWHGLTKDEDTKQYMTVAFSNMLCYNLCLLLLEFSQASAKTPWRFGVILVAFGTYIFPLISAFVISLFVVRQTNYPVIRRRKMVIVLWLILGINFFALLIAQFRGKLVLVDQAGSFTYGSESAMGPIVVAIFMVIDLIILIRYGENITYRQRNAFITYLALPIVGIFLRKLWPGVYVVAFASCISMMIMLGIIQAIICSPYPAIILHSWIALFERVNIS